MGAAIKKIVLLCLIWIDVIALALWAVAAFYGLAGAFAVLLGFVVFLTALLPFAIIVGLLVVFFVVLGRRMVSRRFEAEVEPRRTGKRAIFIRTVKILLVLLLALDVWMAVMAPGFLALFSLNITGDRQRFEGGGIREWLFTRLTLTGRSGQLEPDGKPASYYIRFQLGTVEQTAHMEYGSRRPPIDIVTKFRDFCAKRGLTVSAVGEKADAGELNVTCFAPGAGYCDNSGGSCLYLSAAPAGAGARVFVFEIGMDKY